MKEKILITGGSGFIGTNLIDHLLQTSDCTILNVDNTAPRKREHAPYWKNADLRDRAGLTEAFASFKPDRVYQLAARCDLSGQTLEDYSANTEGVANLIHAAKTAGSVKRILLASTQLVCTPGYFPKDEFDYTPSTLYGESKVIGEGIVREQLGDAIPWVMVRPTSIWGPWFGKLYSTFIRAVGKGLYLHPKDRVIRKSFGYVGNAVYQLVTLMNQPDERMHRRVIYLSDYEAYSIYEWAQMIQRAWGAPPVRQAPISVLRTLAAGGDVMKKFGYTNPPISSYRLHNILTETVFDMEPLRAICGDVPYTLQEGTERTVAWLRTDEGKNCLTRT